MEHRHERARERDDGALLRIAAATLGERQAPAPQLTVRTNRAEDVLRAADEQAAEHGIAAFGKAQLRVPPARVVLARAEADAGDLPAGA